MRKFVTIIFSFILVTVCARAKETVEYFPDQECELGAYMQCGLLASIFGELDEPALLGSKGYRFYWSRSFHHQVIIRLDIGTTGSGSLSVKVFDHSRNFNLLETKVISLGTEQLADIEKHAFKVRAWLKASDTPDSASGTDGAGWCFEIADDGQFNAGCRWSPMAMPPIPITDRNRHIVPKWRLVDDDFNALGVKLIELTGMDLGPVY